MAGRQLFNMNIIYKYVVPWKHVDLDFIISPTTQALHPFAFVFTQYNGMHIDDATCAHKQTHAHMPQCGNSTTTTTGPDLQSNELAKFLRGAITHGDSLVIMNQPVICCKIC